MLYHRLLKPLKLLNEYKYKIPKIWFYEIKGIQAVATAKEIQNAKKLSDVRAKIFLETRSYLRQSLATIFKLDPLEIPIEANPGEPPKLPFGMGYVSLSHCRDAIVIVWHKEKIGIDIERIDRNFNYIRFAEKYFFNTYKSTKSKLTKNMILKQWCAIEAAIKWDHGKLAKDIKSWQYFKNKNKLVNYNKNLHLNCSQIDFYQWTIALTYQESKYLNHEIICSSKAF